MLQSGLTYSLEKKVTAEDSANTYGSGMVDVLATPAMIAFMEKTCLLLALDHLEPGFNTVGIAVDITHNKATPIGMNMRCIASLLEIEGKILKFHVEVFDDQGKAGAGFHKRAIINVEKFMAKLK
ncbi:MAG: thioesterase family protein [Bacteroidales bacterium]|jgi:predicted thioesterase|nr:thioesterase family protein [Bacteroidales bacterium]HPB02298.1 thioesterase family protein [Bacteroidales bacterium]